MKNTIIGFESFLRCENISLFDLMPTPVGINRDILIEKILMDSGEFESLYYDPHVLRELVGVWGRAMHPTFTKWVKALSIEYDPLSNYDRKEESIRNVSGLKDKKINYKSGSDSTAATKVVSKGQDNITSTDSVSAFNSDSFADSSKNVSNNINNSESETDNTTKSNINTSSQDISDEKNIDTFTSRVSGNVGVTTSQQMLEAELDIARWNIYMHISDLFVKEFCILVY